MPEKKAVALSGIFLPRGTYPRFVLDQIIQQNAANSEELAAASEETAAQVTMLRDLVDQFQTSDQMAA